MTFTSRSFRYPALAAVLALAWTAVAAAPAWAQDNEEAQPDAQEAGPEAGPGNAAASGDDAEEPASSIPGWFRFDVDSLGPQFWFGAEHELGGLAIASGIYIDDFFAELDLGVALTFGKLTLTPMAGIGVNFETYEFATLIAPQLFTTYISGPIYFDSWIQVFLSSPFDDAGRDSFYFRAFVVYELTEGFAVGPQVETSVFLNESADGADDGGLSSLPIGAQVSVGYGKNRTLGLFLGYDTQYEGDGDSITGRFTFIQTW
jgi:hypothetical protein